MGTKNFDNALDLITFTRASGGTYLDSDGILKTASTNIPRIEYAADGTLKGLLIEEQRTNTCNNADFATNWTSAAVTATANGAVSPNGNTDALVLTPDSDAASVRRYFHAGSAVSASSVVHSVFVKSNGVDQVAIRESFSTGASAVWTLSTATLDGVHNAGNLAVAETNIQSVGNGWYRISVSFADAGATNQRIGIHLLDGGWVSGDPISDTYANGSGDELYIYGPQVEAGSFPTSYIPTSGATATRSADIASIPVTDFGYNDRKQTLLLTAISAAPDNAAGTGNNVNRLAQLDSVSAINYSSLGIGSTSIRVNRPSLASRNNAGLVVSAGDLLSLDNTFNEGNVVKFAAAFDPVAGTIAGSVNGSAVFSATGDVGGLGVPFTQIVFGKGQGAAYIKSIQYYPRRLTNAQLQELTA